MALPERHNILGVQVHATDYARATEQIIHAAREGRPCSVSALAVHGVMTGRADPDQQVRINQLDLVTPDGQPVRWALNWLHNCGLKDRVYGPFLMLHVCERAAKDGLSVFLFGGDDALLQDLSAFLTRRFPGLRIAGTQASRFRRATDSEWTADVQTLRASNADIVFCGLGCPRQEVWVHEMRSELNRPLIAVGAAFAFWAGRQTMAPAWMQRWGLEWCFRLAREPRRLAGRYLIYNPWFVAALLRQKLFSRSNAASRPITKPPPLHWS
jgi:N-acetylglucosaminyldiphosphoundecaprenol N-acetyl-beta-D-mannosaminyltransferase